MSIGTTVRLAPFARSLFVLASIGAMASMVAGCGSSGTNDTSDASTDSGAPDTRVIPTDTGSATGDDAASDADAGPTFAVACTTDIQPYSCPAPAKLPMGQKVCTDEAIAAIIDGCFGSTATAAKCNAAENTYKSCRTCMLVDWLYTPVGSMTGYADFGGCIAAIDPTDTACTGSARCADDCDYQACVACSTTAGSGTNGPDDTEDNDCVIAANRKGNGGSVQRGQCYDPAWSAYVTCQANPKYAPCFSDLITFYTGACRDGGDWSNTAPLDAGVPDAAGDGAVDAASDVGVDGASDAVSDAASEAAATDAAAADAVGDGAASDGASDAGAAEAGDAASTD